MAKKKKTREEMEKYTGLCYDVDNLIYIRDENNNPIAFREMSSAEEAKAFNNLREFIMASAIAKNSLGDFNIPRNAEYYRIFSDEFAARIYHRMTNKKIDFSETLDFTETIGLTDDRKKAKRNSPVKSCKNLIEKSLHWGLMDFREEYFDQIFAGGDVDSYVTPIVQDNYEERVELYREIFEKMDTYIENTLNHSIYNTNLSVRNDLKLSIQLSLLNMLKTSGEDKYAQLFNQLEQRKDYVIVWGENNHLTKEIILVYIVRVFRYVHREFDLIEQTTYVPEDTVTTLLKSATEVSNTNNNYNQEDN